MHKGGGIVEALLDTARRAPHSPHGKILCRDSDVASRLFWLQNKFRAKWGSGVTLKGSRTLSVHKEEQATCEDADCDGDVVW